MMKTDAFNAKINQAGENISKGLRKAEMNSPLPASIAEECEKCAKIISKFAETSIEKAKLEELATSNSFAKQVRQFIPKDVISNCKGVVILTVAKAGMGISGRGGSGLVLAKLESGAWSAPSGITLAGMGVGWQFGAEITDYVFILNTQKAVEAFHSPTVTLGGQFSVAAGPYGRAGEASTTVHNLGDVPIFSYSYSKGLYAGLSLEGSALMERKNGNAEFYHEPVSAKSILSGYVARPDGAATLYEALKLAEQKS